jgi:autotransporter-associated beta strand protein
MELIVLLLSASPRLALATNDTWIDKTSGGPWSATTNWQNGIVANGTDGIADFSTLTLTTDDTVHLNSFLFHSIGTLKFGDIRASHNWTLDNNGSIGNTLMFSVSSGSPSIVVNNQTATISAGLSGTGVVKRGAGTLVLSGTADNSGLGLTVTAGTVVLAKTSLWPERRRLQITVRVLVGRPAA